MTVKIIDRAGFFDDVRPLYGGSLSQAQVDEMDPALTKWEQTFDQNGEATSGFLSQRWIEAPAGTTPGQMVLSERGTQVLVDREGLRTTAYLDSVGVWTIGVGHADTSPNPPPVYQGMTITTEEAYAIFDVDNNTFEACIRDNVKVPLEQWEFDALVSFAFNVGMEAFKDSTMLKKLNANDKPGAFEQFKQWNKPPEIIPRRRGEAACFGYGLYIARLEDDDPTLAQYKSGALGKPAT
jgi:lysozyme